MGMLKEFKEFAIKGNVIDLAIGVVIGTAFTNIVNSLIKDIITPALLDPALKAAKVDNLEGLTALGGIKYGMFLSAVINFILIAWILFLIVKAANAAKKKEETPVPPVRPTLEQLLTEIRDLLKEQKR